MKIAPESNNDPVRMKTYHHWRALTARLLAEGPRRHLDCIDGRVDSITTKMSSDLRGYTDKKDVFDDGEHKRASNNLASIVRAAVDLDHLLWKQKARFEFYYPRFEDQGTPKFDSSWMTPDDPEANEEMLERKGSKAQLFCAPALLKRGTSEGDSFELCIVIREAVVNCW
jgi:hypothetical protein